MPHDRILYRQRHRIENMFGRLKDWRRVHTRYDRCAQTLEPVSVVGNIQSDRIPTMSRNLTARHFQSKVALEAIRGEQTLAELSSKHGIHQTTIAAWKRQATKRLASTLSGKADAMQATGRRS